MLTCPVCGFRNPDANDTCFRCSALLKRNAAIVDEAFDKADTKRRRMEWRQLYAVPLERFYSHPFIQKLNALPDDEKYRYPFTAGLLSIILPGLGHIYAGQRLKGLVFAGFSSVLLIIAYLSIHESWSNYLLMGMLLFWTFAWGSSVGTAMRANGATLVLRHVYALFFGGMMLLGFFLVVGQYLGIGFISLEKITAGGMAPSLVRGERVMFTSVPMWYRDPRVGEIISFDPPRFVAEKKADAFSINIRRYYQRVIGVAGDRVVKSGEQFWRNGRLLAPDELPFGAEMMDDFDWTVPQGKILAPVTQIPEAGLLNNFGGAPHVPYVGAPGYAWDLWDSHPYIDADIAKAKALAIIDPPERRRWLR